MVVCLAYFVCLLMSCFLWALDCCLIVVLVGIWFDLVGFCCLVFDLLVLALCFVLVFLLCGCCVFDSIDLI